MNPPQASPLPHTDALLTAPVVVPASQPVPAQPAAPSLARLEPADRFYWVLLDLPAEAGTAASKLKPAAKAEIIDLLRGAVIPPIDELEFVPLATAPQQLIVCLQQRSAVQDARDAGCLHYGPSEVLPALGLAVNPQRINFLTGRFTPRAITRASAQRWLLAGVMSIAITAALSIGLRARESAFKALAQADQQALATILTEQRSKALPDLLLRRDRLLATRRRLAEAPNPDAPTSLASLLSAWPKGATAPMAQTESITITAEAITLQLAAQTRDDATHLAEALSSFPIPAPAPSANPERWLLGQPQITSGTAATPGAFPIRASFRFSRAAANPPGATSGDTP